MSQNNAKSILITGGARSGKSRFAENLALEMCQQPTYIATCEILDEEMRSRIETHQQRRGQNWQEVYAPLDLVQAIKNTEGQTRLVDCLTLWINNLIYHELDTQTEFDALLHAINKASSPLIFVSNEVGMGIVPENAQARKFRDLAGLLNQTIAQAANEVYLVASGLPLKMK